MDEAVLVAAVQHPVEQVAGRDKIHADQSRAVDADDRGVAELGFEPLQHAADVADQLARQVDRCGAHAAGLLEHLRLREAARRVAGHHRARREGHAAGIGHLDDAQRRLPRRRRHLVGHAVVDRDLVELVGPVAQPQRRQAQQPVGGVGIAHAGGRGLGQHREQLLGADPAHLQLLRAPVVHQLAQLAARLGVDRAQRAPVDHPRHGQLQRPGAQLRDAFAIQPCRCRPADVALAASCRPAAGGCRVLGGHQLGDREPLRRRPAEALHVVERQALERRLLPGGAVQVEQHEPGLRVVRAFAVIRDEAADRALAALELGIGEGNHRLVELGIVGDLVDLDGERVAEIGHARPPQVHRRRCRGRSSGWCAGGRRSHGRRRR
eukprot:Opistho-2@24509